MDLFHLEMQKVLVPAFSKALKDPFVHTRVAGIAGLTACIDCFEMEDAATKILGVIGGGLVDKEKCVAIPFGVTGETMRLNFVSRLVRDQAFKCLDVYRARIEAYAASMVRVSL
jgi:SCY1-like protein 1